MYHGLLVKQSTPTRLRNNLHLFFYSVCSIFSVSKGCHENNDQTSLHFESMEESIKDLHSLKEKEKLGEVKLKEEDGKNEKADYQVYVKHKKLNPCDSFGALYVSKSLGFLNRDNGLRVKCLKMIKSKRFENCIILLIVANSIVLAMTDYRYVDKEGIPRSEHSWRNKLVEATEIPFTICFAMECFIKIIAMGLFMGNRTYLRDSWNKIDFVVVASR